MNHLIKGKKLEALLKMLSPAIITFIGVIAVMWKNQFSLKGIISSNQEKILQEITNLKDIVNLEMKHLKEEVIELKTKLDDLEKFKERVLESGLLKK